MTSKTEFDDFVYEKLPKPDVGYLLGNILMDDATSPKKMTRTISFAVTPELYQAALELVHHKSLPFMGMLGDFGRGALASFVLGLREYLDDNMQVIFTNLMEQQRRLTRERVLVTIDEVIDRQVDQLRFWSQRSKWEEVIRGIHAFEKEIDNYPADEWREHVAISWLRHDGVKQMMRHWAERMSDEAPHAWQVVRDFTDKMEQYGNV